MNIEFEMKKDYFSNIEKGEAFAYEDNIYMKINSVFRMVDDTNPTHDYYNCVNLKTGNLSYFCKEEKVSPLQVTVAIKQVK